LRQQDLAEGHRLDALNSRDRCYGDDFRRRRS
jgi:hypothetical protein